MADIQETQLVIMSLSHSCIKYQGACFNIFYLQYQKILALQLTLSRGIAITRGIICNLVWFAYLHSLLPIQQYAFHCNSFIPMKVQNVSVVVCATLIPTNSRDR